MTCVFVQSFWKDAESLAGEWGKSCCFCTGNNMNVFCDEVFMNTFVDLLVLYDCGFGLQVAEVSHLDDEIMALHSEIVELQRSPYARRQGDKMEQL